jgi:hypothetical protein
MRCGKGSLPGDGASTLDKCSKHLAGLTGVKKALLTHSKTAAPEKNGRDVV